MDSQTTRLFDPVGRLPARTARTHHPSRPNGATGLLDAPSDLVTSALRLVGPLVVG
jgi:hypothetical protein